MEIKLVDKDSLKVFFKYLDKHLRENGVDSSPVFQPMSLEESKLTPELEARFQDGIQRDLTERGWRKLFVAISSDQVLGHIDIRPYPEGIQATAYC